MLFAISCGILSVGFILMLCGDNPISEEYYSDFHIKTFRIGLISFAVGLCLLSLLYIWVLIQN